MPTLFINSLEKNGKCQKKKGKEISEWFYLKVSHYFVLHMKETILLNGFIEITKVSKCSRNLNYVHLSQHRTLWGKFIFLDKQTNPNKNGY